MFPACCFHQKTNVAQHHMNETTNETRTFVLVCLNTIYLWPCDTLVLWQKQQAGNINVFKNKKIILRDTNLSVDRFILKYLLFSLFGRIKKKENLFTYIYAQVNAVTKWEYQDRQKQSEL